MKQIDHEPHLIINNFSDNVLILLADSSDNDKKIILKAGIVMVIEEQFCTLAKFVFCTFVPNNKNKIYAIVQ